MFNIGGGELIVILLVALIVLGPQRLPDAARQLGKAMGDLRRLSTGFQNEMKQALDTADDPTRVAARRNVLATEPAEDVEAGDPEPAEDVEAGDTETAEDVEAGTDSVIDASDPIVAPAPDDAAAESIAAVSAQPSAPAPQTPPASQGGAADTVAAAAVPEDPPRPSNP